MIRFYKDGKEFHQPEPIQFSGGERHIQLVPSYFEAEVDITATINNSNDLMDLVLTLNAIDNIQSKLGFKSEIRVQIPYMPYSRQDRVCADGQAFSLSVIVSMILTSHPKVSIITWDIHSDVFNCITSVPQSTFLNQESKLREILYHNSHLLVQPDKGAKDRCQELKDNTDLFRGEDLVVGSKSRNPKTGWIDDYKVSGTDVKGRDCFIADDICDGGMTFILLAKALKEAGANSVVLFVTHGIFSKGLSDLHLYIDDIYTTNSLNNKDIIPSSMVINYEYFTK